MTAIRHRLADGRSVTAHWLAEGDGPMVVLCHPAPGAGNFDPDAEQTAKRGVTLVAVDRPGYGGSEPLPDSEWSSVGRAADELAEVIESLGRPPLEVAGWSAGGRVALALAARRPALVDRVAVVGTPAPDEEVPWIPDEVRAGLDALRGRPAAEVHAVLREQLAPVAAADPASAEALEQLGASPADDAALDLPGARERLAAMVEAAFAQGVIGLAADIAGYSLQSWGFEPSEVPAKTLLIYGSSDPIATPRHGTWWQKRLPNARLEVNPGAGHLLVVPMWRRVLSHLAPRRSASRG